MWHLPNVGIIITAISSMCKSQNLSIIANKTTVPLFWQSADISPPKDDDDDEEEDDDDDDDEEEDGDDDNLANDQIGLIGLVEKEWLDTLATINPDEVNHYFINIIIFCIKISP